MFGYQTIQISLEGSRCQNMAHSPGRAGPRLRGEGEAFTLRIFMETLQPQPPPLLRQKWVWAGLGGQLWLQRPLSRLVDCTDSCPCPALPSQRLHPTTLLSSFLSVSRRSRKQGFTHSPAKLGSGDAAGSKTAVVFSFKVSEPIGDNNSSVGGDNSGCWGL